MKYDAIIFDLDGTLVDSLGDIAFSMNKVLEERNEPLHDMEAYQYFIGEGIGNLVRKALPEDKRDEDTVENGLKAMMDIYRRHCAVKTSPYNGIKELLDELSTKKLKLAILSNKVDELTKLVVGDLLGKYNFEVVMGFRTDLPRKPNPKSALLIANTLGIEPNRIMFVGDTGIDMQTANAAGMYGVGVLWGYRNRQELEEMGAKIIISHPLELLEVL